FALCAERDTCSAPGNLAPMARTLRTRLTLWYVAALSAVLILFSAGVYFFVERTLRERVDANLRLTLQSASSALTKNSAPSSVDDALEDPHFPGQIVAVVDANGRILAKKPVNSALVFRLPALPLRPSPSPQFYELPESAPDADDSSRGVYQLVAA